MDSEQLMFSDRYQIHAEIHVVVKMHFYRNDMFNKYFTHFPQVYSTYVNFYHSNATTNYAIHQIVFDNDYLCFRQHHETLSFRKMFDVNDHVFVNDYHNQQTV